MGFLEKLQVALRVLPLVDVALAFLSGLFLALLVMRLLSLRQKRAEQRRLKEQNETETEKLKRRFADLCLLAAQEFHLCFADVRTQDQARQAVGQWATERQIAHIDRFYGAVVADHIWQAHSLLEFRAIEYQVRWETLKNAKFHITRAKLDTESWGFRCYMASKLAAATQQGPTVTEAAVVEQPVT